MVLVLNIFLLQTSEFDSEPATGLLILAWQLTYRRSMWSEMDSFTQLETCHLIM
jgi:hypothetical protein